MMTRNLAISDPRDGNRRKGTDVRRQIMEIVGRHSLGVLIQDLHKQMGMADNTVVRHCKRLAATGHVVFLDPGRGSTARVRLP